MGSGRNSPRNTLTTGKSNCASLPRSVQRKDIGEAVTEFLAGSEHLTHAANGQRAQLSAKYAYNREIQLRKFAEIGATQRHWRSRHRIFGRQRTPDTRGQWAAGATLREIRLQPGNPTAQVCRDRCNAKTLAKPSPNFWPAANT